MLPVSVEADSDEDVGHVATSVPQAVRIQVESRGICIKPKSLIFHKGRVECTCPTGALVSSRHSPSQRHSLLLSTLIVSTRTCRYLSCATRVAEA